MLLLEQVVLGSFFNKHWGGKDSFLRKEAGVLEQQFLKCGLRPEASASPENVFEVHPLGSPKPSKTNTNTNTKTSWALPPPVCFKKPTG